MFVDVDEVLKSLEGVQREFDNGNRRGDLVLLENKCLRLCHLESFVPGCFDAALVLAQAISAIRLKADHAAERNLRLSITMLRRINFREDAHLPVAV